MFGLGAYSFGDVSNPYIQVVEVGNLIARYYRYFFGKLGYRISFDNGIVLEPDLLMGRRQVRQSRIRSASFNGWYYSLTGIPEWLDNFFISARLNAKYQLKTLPLGFGIRANPIYNFIAQNDKFTRYGFNAMFFLSVSL